MFGGLRLKEEEDQEVPGEILNSLVRETGAVR
jgi:hypothetical protein